MTEVAILQLAAGGTALRTRVERHVGASSEPARIAREVGLALVRARAAVTHAVGLVEGPLEPAAASSRLDQVLSLEAGRQGAVVHGEDGVAVFTMGVLATSAPFRGVGDRGGLERALQALAAVPDGAVVRFVVHVAPREGDSFDPATLGASHPQLPALDGTLASGWSPCRFCAAPMERYRTSCPSCGGAVTS